MSAKSDKCVCCKEIVRPRQEGLECEKCQRWQHRTCNSGITRNLYRKLCKGTATLEWFCEECKSTVATQQHSSQPSRRSLSEFYVTVDSSGLGPHQSTPKETITFSSSSFSENLNIIEYDEVGRTEDEDRQSVYDINNKTCSDFLPNNECDDSQNSQEESPLVEGPIEIHPTSTDRLALYGNNQTYPVENGEHPKQTISEESNAVFDESSVSEDEMDIVEPQNHSTSYHIEENCSNKGKPKLFDTL